MEKQNWQPLYKTTAILTIIMLIIIPVQIIIFTTTTHPDTTIGWIKLFNTNPVLGLIHMDLLYLVNNIILVFIYFSLFLALYKTNRNSITIALILGTIGLIAYIASNKAIEMFFLSREFLLATDELTQNSLIVSAKNMLLEWKGTSYVTYYFLGCITLFLISFAMFNSRVFPKAAAVWALISAIFMTIPANFGMIGLIFSLLSLIPWYIFCIYLVIAFLNNEFYQVSES
ncbi:MAG: hypothetical protein A2015_13320 [Spirochaetes bacterium GWF1_31_7]|nr:MAG: hypothetical protein A2Y29_07240 [Spirochaetes bacterium GWE2_31_10]OHD49227.1 MAG: hypothetical protein A2015_13320 [Spirochaetes bacterium GWF1_31_7]HBD95479.1 hypothetical protein [Spirochaetia bacterium]